MSVTLQAQDSAYKSTWQSVPSVTNSGGGTAASSSKAASLFASQHVSKNPLDQRLLQEDAIRRSGVSGPLGMGVVLQSELYTVHCSQTVTQYMWFRTDNASFSLLSSNQLGDF